MNKWKLAILVTLTTLVQAYFFSAFSSSLLVPNLAVIMIVYITIKRPTRLAFTLALWTGFLLDVASAQVGPRMVVLTSLVGIVVLLKRLGLELEHISIQLAIIALGCVLYNVIGLGLQWVDLGAVSWNWDLAGWWIFEILWTLIIAVLAQKQLQKRLQTTKDSFYI